MKKLLLTGGLIAVFIVYGLHQQQESANVNVAPQTNISTQDSSQQTPTTGESSSGTTPPSQSALSGQYKDGAYTGSVADAFYGNIQVKAVIEGGKITDVQFLQYPNDRGESIQVNTQAMPYLKQEAIQAQNSQVDIVSGATQSSEAFIQSLGSALAQAK